jgi:hypothetical protein
MSSSGWSRSAADHFVKRPAAQGTEVFDAYGAVGRLEMELAAGVY